jgi:hypothetical protein
MVASDGAVLCHQNNRVRYQNVINFVSHGVRSVWSRTVISALLAEHPHALDLAAPEPAYADEGEGPL